MAAGVAGDEITEAGDEVGCGGGEVECDFLAVAGKQNIVALGREGVAGNWFAGIGFGRGAFGCHDGNLACLAVVTQVGCHFLSSFGELMGGVVREF